MVTLKYTKHSNLSILRVKLHKWINDYLILHEITYLINKMTILTKMNILNRDFQVLTTEYHGQLNRKSF